MDPGDRHVFYYSQPELIKFCSSTVVSSLPPLSNGNFFDLLNRRTNDEIKNILVGKEVSNDSAKIKDDRWNFFKDLYKLVSDDLGNDVNFFRHIEAVDQGRVGEIE